MKEPVHLSDDTVLLVVPNDVTGWSVIPDRMPCEVHNGTLHQYVFINGIRVSGCTLWFMFLLFLALTLRLLFCLLLSSKNSTGFCTSQRWCTQEAQFTLTVRGFVEAFHFHYCCHFQQRVPYTFSSPTLALLCIYSTPKDYWCMIQPI